MAVAAFVLSVVSIGLSAAALVIAVRHWRMDGPVLVVTAALKDFPLELATGKHWDFFTFMVRNRGRGHAFVTLAAWLAENDSIVELRLHDDLKDFAPTLPRRLEAGEQMDWGFWMWGDDLRVHLDRLGHSGPVRLRPFANLGSGDRVVGDPIVIDTTDLRTGPISPG